MKIKINICNQDLEINLEEYGKKGTPILFVHGIPTNARLWRHVQHPVFRPVISVFKK